MTPCSLILRNLLSSHSGYEDTSLPLYPEYGGDGSRALLSDGVKGTEMGERIARMWSFRNTCRILVWKL